MKVKSLIVSMLAVLTMASLTGCSSSSSEVVEGKIEKHCGNENTRYSYVLISYDGYYDRDCSNIAWDMKDGSKVKIIKTTYKNADGGITGVRLDVATYGGF